MLRLVATTLRYDSLQRLYVATRSNDFTLRLVERLYVTTRSSDFTLRPVAATLCRDS
ncbi:hypothetical protein [Pseudoalteromonas sp. M8]|uniref:hypothetical protein n=1 Tax=Pseudoalteromonas sp. M8 TaxID=2692624 RepID=UPI001BA8C685|nr:hypothetical protein [Pseudoalteromonas sp. M8]QUI69736.1 hypothetical protein GSF13_07995 [Pseudoalteromonas sp. M8]